MAGARETFCTCNKLQGKVVVITDCAASGIARECAEAGATVYFGFKDLTTALFVANDLRYTAKKGVMHPVPLDVDNLVSCIYFTRSIKKMEKHVDFIVFNNAGCDHLSLQTTRDQYVGIWQANYLANVVILENLFPTLRREGSHGLIFISSRPYSNVSLKDIKEVSQMKTKHNSESKICSLENYTRSKYALWLYASFRFSMVTGWVMVPLIFVEPWKVSTKILRSSARHEVVAYKVFETDSFTGSGRQTDKTILHCIQNPSLDDNQCMLGVGTIEIAQNYGLEEAHTFIAKTVGMLDQIRNRVSGRKF